jgi:glucosamine kinase
MRVQVRHLQRQAGAARPRWHLGVDGGGTHTRLRWCDAQGLLIGEGHAGASALGQGPEQAWASIQFALQGAASQAGMALPNWGDCALGVGLSGASSPVLAHAFLAADPGCALLALDSDGLAALLGAHGGAPGALMIAGTGSVGEVLRPDGSHHQVGGWGWQIGDEGSGAWLGRIAVQHTQRALDGRAQLGSLAQAVLAQARSQTRLGAANAALLAWCAAAGQRAYADLAPLVFLQAEQDPAAAELLERTVAELNALALALDPSGSLPLVLSGSIATRLQPRLAPAVLARCVPAKADALAGALQLVQNALSESS